VLGSSRSRHLAALYLNVGGVSDADFVVEMKPIIGPREASHI
jgi:hypothetical protein